MLHKHTKSDRRPQSKKILRGTMSNRAISFEACILCTPDPILCCPESAAGPIEEEEEGEEEEEEESNLINLKR